MNIKDQQQAFNAALDAFNRNDFRTSETLCRQLLQQNKQHLNALLLLSDIAVRTSHLDAALELVQYADACHPGHRSVAQRLGDIFIARKEPSKAVDAVEKALTKIGGDPILFTTVANAYTAMGNHAAALEKYQAALELAPDQFIAASNAGAICAHLKRLDDAEKYFRHALSLAPTHQSTRVNLAVLLIELRRYSNALAEFKIVQEQTGAPLSHWNKRLRCYRLLGDYQRAMALVEDVLTKEPGNAKARLEKSYILRHLLRHSEAITLLQEIVGDAPDTPTTAKQCLADTYAEISDFKHADPLFLDLIKENPTNLRTRYYYGLTLLRRGRFKEGFENYRHRLSLESLRLHNPFDLPRWEGEPLKGKRIILHNEQGIGDDLIYASMIRDVLAQQPEACAIQCKDRLLPIFERSFPEALMVPDSALADFDPSEYDLQSALGDLGQWLRTSFDTFPVHKGYLSADAALSASLRDSYQALFPGKRLIGLAWKSRGTSFGGNKSLQLSDMAPLANLTDCVFINLQYGDTTADIAYLRETLGLEIHDNPAVDPLEDMEGAIAEIDALDHVITTSNTTAHCAGALGKPASILLPTGPGRLWYWFEDDRDSSPWYPSVRLYNRSSDQSWLETLNRVAASFND